MRARQGGRGPRSECASQRGSEKTGRQPSMCASSPPCGGDNRVHEISGPVGEEDREHLEHHPPLPLGVRRSRSSPAKARATVRPVLSPSVPLPSNVDGRAGKVRRMRACSLLEMRKDAAAKESGGTASL